MELLASPARGTGIPHHLLSYRYACSSRLQLSLLREGVQTTGSEKARHAFCGGVAARGGLALRPRGTTAAARTLDGLVAAFGSEKFDRTQYLMGMIVQCICGT